MKKLEKTYIESKIKNKKGDIISYLADIKKDGIETPCHKFENLYEMKKFPEKQKSKTNTKRIRKPK